MGVRATFIEIWKRVVRTGITDTNIYLNGDNNLYPNEVEGVINNSPTAKRAALMMAKYISGKGLTNPDFNIIVNKNKNYKVTDIIDLTAKSISYQNGAFIHTNYKVNTEGGNIVFNTHTLDVLDYVKCRISKEDDLENKGKIYYKDYEKRTSYKSSNNIQWFYPYNPDPDVILSQIKNDFKLSQEKIKEKKEFTLEEGIKTYRGQVYYLNLSPYIYALSPIDAAYNDADTEYRISLYTNKQPRSGWMGKTIVISNGLDEEKSDEINEQLKNFLGAENSDSVWHVEFDGVEDINNILKVVQLKAQFDDKLFSDTKKDLRKNILGQFNNIPEALVFSGDSALFGTSGETYREMKKFYSEQTETERNKIEQMLEMFGYPVKIKEIGNDL